MGRRPPVRSRNAQSPGGIVGSWDHSWDYRSRRLGFSGLPVACSMERVVKRPLHPLGARSPQPGVWPPSRSPSTFPKTLPSGTQWRA
jgi:hypothetical protein